MKTCRLIVEPQSVKNNPFIDLWQAGDPSSQGFQKAFISQMGLLMKADDINRIHMSIPDEHNAGESISQPGAAGANIYSPDEDFATAIEAALPATSDFTADHVTERAMTQSCTGCHPFSPGVFLGPDNVHGLTWPSEGSPFFFVHIDEDSDLSNALTMERCFLDHRQQILERILNMLCDVDCLDEALVKGPDGDLLLSTDIGPGAPDEPVSFHEDTLSGHITH